LNIHTLIPDIQKLVTQKDGWFNDELSAAFSQDVARRLSAHFGRAQTATLRLSQMGPKCPCQLWHSIHSPDEAERLPPWAEIKYSYGHILEALAITLARAAGHTVTGEQDEVSVDGILGHRDCVIDGCVVDVKSTSSIGFKKFRDGSIKHSDSFGYLEQLDGYLVGSLSDPLVTVKDKGYLLAIDKTLGHMCLYEHRIREDHIRARVKESIRIVGEDTPPPCTCGVVSDGQSGNLKLDIKASYNPFKYLCKPELRTFIYAAGPVYLTKVVRKPDVLEVDRFGKVVYN